MDFAPGIDPRERIFDSSLDEAKEMLERVKAGHQTLTEGISEFLFKGSNNSATTPILPENRQSSTNTFFEKYLQVVHPQQSASHGFEP
ncbi:MAG TPA: hypothetical protein VK673_10165 [Chthoniobacterales bacterium]|jgi:hypothetical protein|nr:hypothetical protein [Chthoniobacterales bacterium]